MIALKAGLLLVSVIALAFFIYWLLARRRLAGQTGGQAPRTFKEALHFLLGPFPLSIALHVAVLLILLYAVHTPQGMQFITIHLEGGGGGGSHQELNDLNLPPADLPDTNPVQMERPTVVRSSQVVSLANNYVRAAAGAGIGAGRGGGIGSGYGMGVGRGFGGFIGGLRRKGLDVMLVIDGTGSMKLIINDVKARMEKLAAAIHRMVPTARIGIIVFGGRSEKIQVEPLTFDAGKLDVFLSHIRAHNGGVWQEDTLGAVRTAVDGMAWKPRAKKVIVLVGDTPPFAEDYEPVLALIRKFRNEDGTFNTVDVTVEEHERFIRQWWLSNYGTLPKEIPPLPDFYIQTQNAYRTMAAAGGGSWHSLTKDKEINQQVLILAFGEQWRSEVAAFGRGLSTPAN
jgi:von Willebrand factor type A domain